MAAQPFAGGAGSALACGAWQAISAKAAQVHKSFALGAMYLHRFIVRASSRRPCFGLWHHKSRLSQAEFLNLTRQVLALVFNLKFNFTSARGWRPILDSRFLPWFCHTARPYVR
jgi:hypothetical protein